MSYTQTIYNRLRYHGLSEAGALGALGNFWCESNCEPARLQGDFSSYRTASKAYVQGVTSGSIGRETFSKDGRGFGIYQLTYWTRKQGYYDFWKRSGKALDDAELQVDYAVQELKEDYPSLLAYLKVTTDIFSATSRFCREFERPAVNNIDARYQAAKRIQAEIDLTWPKAETSTPVSVKPGTVVQDNAVYYPTPISIEYWPPRTIDKTMSGSDVLVLKAILAARGYLPNFVGDTDGYLDGETDIFDDETEKAVKKFQKEHGLVADGIVGPKTWGVLLIWST